MGIALSPRSGQQGFVSAALVQNFFRVSEMFGLARDAIVAESGIDAASFNPPNGWVPLSVLEHMVRCTVRRWPDPVWCLRLATAVEPAVYGLTGYLIQCCPSLLEMHRMAATFERLLSNAWMTTLAHEPGVVLWCVDCISQDADFARHSNECYLGACAGLIRKRCPDALIGVRLKHAAPAGELPDTYHKAFGCPVQFDQPRSALVLKASCLNLPLPMSDPVVFETLYQQAQRMLLKVGYEPSLIDIVRQQLRRLLGHVMPSRDLVAQHLGISGRQLHRQLQELNSSYQQILDDLRTELTHDYLREPQYDVSDVAQKLGFAEPNSFVRWFSRHTGMTPLEFHRQGRRAES